MHFGEKAFKFYYELKPPDIQHSNDIEILNPLKEEKVLNILEAFYNKFYHDDRKRIFLIGINPGRFGGGITGIPFTDPVNLDTVLGISNDFDKKHELSSRFIYEVISSIGGANVFFKNFYLTSVSPFGFVKDDKNLNYYDEKILQISWEPFLIKWLKLQIDFGADRKIAFSLGMGKNLNYLQSLNSKMQFFNKIEPLPHPRWVMQYQYKKRHDFSKIYIKKLISFIYL